MAKKAKKYSSHSKSTQVNEPISHYNSVRRLPVVTDLPFSKFKKIASRVPFSTAEWANILQLSERTLQRYTKDNKGFEGIYVDRIHHIEQLINLALETFSSPQAFYEWLKKEKRVLGHSLGFEALYSMQGIQDLIDQLERIQQGIYT